MTNTQNFPLSPQAVNEVVAWAKQAGQIALNYFQHVTPQRKPDNTFLTEADLEIEQFLVERLRSAFPEHGLIGEEGAHEEAGAADYVWAIDPIDGTTVFVQGLPGWGISMGLLQAGQPRFGLFYVPLLDDLTYTKAQNEVYWNDQQLVDSLRRDWQNKGFLALTSTSHADFKIDVRYTRTLGSIGVGLVYAARGAATAVFSSDASLWDIAAGAAILAPLGGELRYLSGKTIDYATLLDGRRTPEPLIAGHPTVLNELQRLIRPKSWDER